MKRLLLLGLIMLAMVGCDRKYEDSKAHDAKVAQEAREQLLAELKAKKEAECKAALKQAQMEVKKQSALVQAGIETTPDGKIIIDTNKTKSYFEQLARKMKSKMDKLTADMQTGMIEEKEAGIEVSEDRIEIDLNKTRNFLDKWAQNAEHFAKELDMIANELNRTIKGY